MPYHTNRFSTEKSLGRSSDNLEKYLLGEVGGGAGSMSDLSNIALASQRGARARNWDEQTKRISTLTPAELKALQIQNQQLSNERDAQQDAYGVLQTAMLPTQSPVPVEVNPLSALNQPDALMQAYPDELQGIGETPFKDKFLGIDSSATEGVPGVEPKVNLENSLMQAAIFGNKNRMSELSQIMAETEGGGYQAEEVAPVVSPSQVDSVVSPVVRPPVTEQQLRAASLMLHGHKGLTKNVILSEQLLREELSKDDAIERLKVLSDKEVGLADVLAGKQVGLAEVLAEKAVGLNKNEVIKIVTLDENKKVKEAAVAKANNVLEAKKEELKLQFGPGGSEETIARLEAEIENKSKEVIAANKELEVTKRELKESTEETIRKIEESKQETIRKKKEAEEKTIQQNATDQVNLKIAQDKHLRVKEAAAVKAQKVYEAKTKELNLIYGKNGSAERIAKLEADVEAASNKLIAANESLEETKRQIEESKQATLRAAKESEEGTIQSAATNEMTKALGLDQQEKELEAAKYETDMEETVGKHKNAAWLLAQKDKNKLSAEGKKTSNTLRTSGKDGKPIKPTDLEDTLQKKLAEQSALDAQSLKVVISPGDPGNANPYGIFDFGLNDPIPPTPPIEAVLPPTQRGRLAEAHKGGGDPAGMEYLYNIGKTPTETVWLMWKQFGWKNEKRDKYLAAIPPQTEE